MIRKILLFYFLLFTISFFAQNTQKSEAYKKFGLSRKTPLIKPKYPSYNLAATYVLKEKAKKGDPFAQHELGIRYILGIGVPVDTVKAAHWVGKAASKNLPAANFNFGIMCHSGLGASWNPFLAFKNFKVAAESGMEQAQYILGLMHTDNLIVNKNLSLAQEWLVKSANKGFEEAQKVIDEFKKQGMFIYKDSTITETSSEQLNSKVNNFSSIVSDDYELDFYNFSEDSLSETEEKEMLNKILATKNDELKKVLKIKKIGEETKLEDTTAISIIDFAASQGSPEALLIRGRLFEFGIGVKNNLLRAATNYMKAYRLGSFKAAESLLKISQVNNFYNILEKNVTNNNPDAMYVWAGLIALGMDYSLTENQAFELLEKGKVQNHVNSIIEIALAYYSGSLVERDSIAAIDNLEYASRLGSIEAKVRLAFIRLQSKTSHDAQRNIQVLKKYSNIGSVLAEAALAHCYENGLEIEKNKGKAAKLYRNAAQRGNEAAYNSLRNMYDEIRPEEEIFQIYN